jgi:hypothetical protein
VVIKTNRSDKTEIKKILKISGRQQRWPRPLPGAIRIPPALLVGADLEKMNDERSWGEPKIQKASEKDNPAGTFPDVEGFQKSVEPD